MDRHRVELEAIRHRLSLALEEAATAAREQHQSWAPADSPQVDVPADAPVQTTMERLQRSEAYYLGQAVAYQAALRHLETVLAHWTPISRTQLFSCPLPLPDDGPVVSDD